MAASTTNTINRLRAFNHGEIDIPDLEMFQIIDAEILKAKQPVTTTHKIMFTNTFGAYKAIALVLSRLSPDCKKIAFIMKGGVARHDHWRAEHLSEAGLLDFFDYTTGDELNPGSLLWEIDLHTNNEGQQAVKDMRCVVFDRLDHGSTHPVTGERMLEIPQLGQLDRGYIQHTIKKDNCEEALTYAFGHLMDTVRAGTSMENDEDINMAEMNGGSGLYALSKTNDVDKAWGDLDWLINTINGPRTSGIAEARSKFSSSQPTATQAWGRWQQHQAANEYGMMDNSTFVPYDSRAATSGLMNIAIMAPQHMVGGHCAMQTMGHSCPTQNHSAYFQYNTPPASMNMPFRLPAQQDCQNLPASSPKYEIPRGSPSTESETKLGNPKAPHPLNTKDIKSNNPTSTKPVNFTTTIDTLMKAIQNRADLDEIVKGDGDHA